MNIRRTVMQCLLAVILTAVAGLALAETPREKTIVSVFGRLDLASGPNEKLSVWMDGAEFFIPRFYDVANDEKPRFDGDTIYFRGGSLHEGGDGFDVRLDENGAMTVSEGDGLRFKQGDLVECRAIGNGALLIVRDPQTKTVKNVFRKERENADLLDTQNSLHELAVRNLREFALAGVYQGKTGTVRFLRDRNAVAGLWGAGVAPYVFAEEYHAPMPLIVSEGQATAWLVKKTLTGLELAPMKVLKDADEGTAYFGSWEPDASKTVITLAKTAETGISAERGDGAGDILLENFFGRYTLSAQRVLTRPELRIYAGKPLAENLKIMRNEIFARYNYRFKSADMQAYFGKYALYRPERDDVTGRLSEIEKINVEMIQALEKKE